MRNATILLTLSALLLLAGTTGWCQDREATAQEETPLYEYDPAHPPETFFFPADKAHWDGRKISVREWYLLDDLQKQKFINEYLNEMSKNYRFSIDVSGLDYLRALNMFSYFSNDKTQTQPTTKVIDTLLEGQGKLTPPPDTSPARPIAGTTKLIVGLGDTFTITLVSNPTTGYQWKVKEPFRTDIIELVNNDYLPDRTGLAGSGGREVWNFKATGEGVTTVTFIYIRPWEKKVTAEKEARFVIAVLPKTEAAGL